MKGKFLSSVFAGVICASAIALSGCGGASADMEKTSENLSQSISYVQTSSAFTSRDLVVGSVKFNSRLLPKYSTEVLNATSSSTEYSELTQIYDSMFMLAFDYICKHDELFELKDIELSGEAKRLLSEVDANISNFNSAFTLYQKDYVEFTNFVDGIATDSLIAKAAVLKYKKGYKKFIRQTINLALSVSAFQEVAFSEEDVPYIELAGNTSAHLRSLYDDVSIKMIDVNFNFLIDALEAKTPVNSNPNNIQLASLVELYNKQKDNHISFVESYANASTSAKLSKIGFEKLVNATETFEEECNNFTAALSALIWHKLIFNDQGDMSQFEGNYAQVSNLKEVELFVIKHMPNWTGYLNKIFL